MEWHYASGGKPVGPVGDREIRRLIERGVVTGDTLVWRAGFGEWTRQAEVRELDFSPSGTASECRGSERSSPAAARPSGGPPEEHAVEFTGSAGEYFRIWIVNIALTVLTLGIYAAWAKVRKRRYLYANTLLQGRAFEYTGNPRAILKGNLIMGAGAVLYSFASTVSPLLGIVALAVFGAVFPWLMWKALRFNAYNTRYRNIRFKFRGTLGESYGVYLGWAALGFLSFGLAWPAFFHRSRRNQYGNLAYGMSPFEFGGRVGKFYMVALATVGFFLLAMIPAAVASALTMEGAQSREATVRVLAMLPFLAFYLAGAFLSQLYFRVRTGNHCIDNTSVPGLAMLRSSMRFRDLVWIEFTNTLAILFSLGLALPWATIRRSRYRATHLHVTLTGDLDEVVAAAEQAPDALGDSASDMFDFDIAL